jgi:hypothetical protein
MHVLLPKDPGHQPFLTHDRESTGSRSPQGFPSHQTLHNTLIDLTPLPTSTPLADPPPKVANLAGICAVPKTLVSNDQPGHDIVCRVTFDAGSSSIAPCGEGARCSFRGNTDNLPIRVVWEIQVDDPQDVLTIKRLSLNNSGGLPDITLHPHPAASPPSKELDIWIFNSPPGQLPSRLPPKTRRLANTHMSHFQAFYKALGCNGPSPQIVTPPVYNAICYDPGGTLRPEGLDLTCVAAQAPLGP